MKVNEIMDALTLLDKLPVVLAAHHAQKTMGRLNQTFHSLQCTTRVTPIGPVINLGVSNGSGLI